MSEVAHIPQLRFPEFEGSWSSVSILGTTNPELKYGIVDGPFGSNLKTIHYKKSGIPIITSGYVTDGFFNADSYLYVTEEKFNKEKRSAVNGGDIVMAKIGARCGSSAILPKNHPTGILSGNALKITVDNNSHSTNFIWQILWSLYQGHKLDLLRTVGAQPAISIANLKKYKLSLPTKPEQQKIAAFLTEVDTKIEQLSKKQELLGEYKKGLMQQIFSQVIRFKADDGCDFPDWEEKKLGGIGSFYRGHTYNSTNVKNNGLLVLRSSNIKNDKLVLDKDLQFVDKICSDKISLRTDDIVICMANGSKHLVGKSGVYYGDYDNKLTVGAFCSIFRTDNKLSKYILQTVQYKRYLHILLAGTNINNLKNSELAELKFNLPVSINEQTKIANFLSSIDSKIEQVSKQLVESKQFKKALLQQMFV